MFQQTIYSLTTWIIPLLLCIIIHEVAHGFVAMKLGDRTALYEGRLTLNPLPHIDLIGSIIVPIVLIMFGSHFLFGWAKPVPISFQNLNKPKRDMGLVAAAGPVSNFLLAIIFLVVAKVVFYIVPQNSFIFSWIFQNLQNGIALTLALCIFNLLPILPLDGGRIIASILPHPYDVQYQQSEKYGFPILFALLFVFPMLGIDLISSYVNYFYGILIRILSMLM